MKTTTQENRKYLFVFFSSSFCYPESAVKFICILDPILIYYRARRVTFSILYHPQYIILYYCYYYMLETTQIACTTQTRCDVTIRYIFFSSVFVFISVLLFSSDMYTLDCRRSCYIYALNAILVVETLLLGGLLLLLVVCVAVLVDISVLLYSQMMRSQEKSAKFIFFGMAVFRFT